MRVSLQWRAIQNFKMYVSLHEVTKGLHRRRKNLHFTTVLDVRRARSDERVARAHREFAFHHSFRRPTITFCVKDCFGELKNLHFTTVLGVRRSLFALRVASASSRICISPQFWASDHHFLREGLLGDVKILHFTTVLGVRRARSDERVVSRRDLPNLPCGKHEKKP